MIEILSIAFTLFLLMDAPGNIPLFVAILKGFSEKKQRKIIFRELTIALGVIILFALAGEALLDFLKIKQYTILVSGGIILFLIALKMIFPSETIQSQKPETKDPFVVPLAIPLIAGPACLAAVIIYSHKVSIGTLVFSILVSWCPTTLILLGSSKLHKLLGDRGLIACERLMGLILTLMATQMFLEGIQCFVQPSCQNLVK
ncbi:MAG: hypothetical protein FJZ57_06835 [Chlamydiae bacterium]|nr:hypothetical protein [Chlamydiota bacterium]